ncbi:MAG: hypothetical protein OK404_03885 [Thaumarchaeota archaeon]|nr:hypothetical protein [Nitrososphaerota archaeon]
MSSDLTIFLEVGLLLVSSGVFAFSGYQAFQLRRVLVSGIYRRKASWNAAFAIFLVPLSAALLPFLGSTAAPSDLLETGILIVFIMVGNIVGYLFLDSAIQAARQMDFFLRDTLQWGILRGPAWAIFLIGMLGALFGPQTGILPQVFGVMWSGPFGYYAAVLAFSSLKVKDRVMRSYAKWVGLFASMVAIGFLYPGRNVPFILGCLVVGSLFFYRATSSLALTGSLEE